MSAESPVFLHLLCGYEGPQSGAYCPGCGGELGPNCDEDVTLGYIGEKARELPAGHYYTIGIIVDDGETFAVIRHSDELDREISIGVIALHSEGM